MTRTLWPDLPKRLVARMLDAHSVMGLVAGALLYILSVSGTIAVIHAEISRFEQPHIPEYETVAPDTVMTALQAGLATAEGEDVHHLYTSLPVPDMPRMQLTVEDETVYVGPDGALLEPVSHPFTDFLLDLHYYLHLPQVIGLTLVGALGAVMAGLVVTGFLAHPRVFRDAFALRLSGAPRLREADIHNRLSVWASPFHFTIGLTGALLGMATIVAVLNAELFHEGDIEAFYAPIFGSESEGPQTPAPLHDAAAALRTMERQHPDLRPWFVSYHDPATAGQSLEILTQHPRRLIYGENYFFDAQGNLTGQMGLADGPVGQQVTASVYSLHFGWFGGVAVKIGYILLGIALCVVVATGVNIWLMKRAERGRPSPRLERVWTGLVWGTPAITALVLLAATLGLSGPVLTAIFWIGLVLVLAAGLAASGRDTVRRALCFIGAGLIAAAVGVYLGRHGGEIATEVAWVLLATLAACAAALLGLGIRGAKGGAAGANPLNA